MSFGRAIISFVSFIFFFVFLPSQKTQAAAPLNYHYKHFLFTIDPLQQKNWTREQELWTYAGKPMMPPQNLRVDGDNVPKLPEGFQKKVVRTLDKVAVAQTIDDAIGSELNREAGSVTIGMTSTGA